MAKKAQSYAYIASCVFYGAKINYPQEELHVTVHGEFYKTLI
jgi:hypothetical protein